MPTSTNNSQHCWAKQCCDLLRPFAWTLSFVSESDFQKEEKWCILSNNLQFEVCSTVYSDINGSLAGVSGFREDIVSEASSDSGGISLHDGSKSDTDSDYNPEPSALAISSSFSRREQSCSYTLTPSTRSRVLWKTETFSSEYGYRPHVSSVFGHRKRRFPNTLSRVGSFENGDSSYSCGQAKTEGFKYDDVMPRFKAPTSAHTIRKRYVWTEIVLNTKKKPPFSKVPGYVWTVKYDSKTLRVEADFFKYGGKTLRVPGYVWTRPLFKRLL